MACGGHVVDGSGQNGQSLERTFHKCFLPSFTSFGWAVSEKTKMWKVNGRQKTDARWWQKLTLLLAWWAKNENRTVAILWKALLYIWQCIFYMINRNSPKKNLWCRQGYISLASQVAPALNTNENGKYRITAILKVETDIIDNISASPIDDLGYFW